MGLTQNRKVVSAIAALVFFAVLVVMVSRPRDTDRRLCVPNPAVSTRFTIASYYEGNVEKVSELQKQVTMALQKSGWTVDNQSATEDRLVIEAHLGDVLYRAEARIESGRFKMWAITKETEK